jgi:hypothetical protein
MFMTGLSRHCHRAVSAITPTPHHLRGRGDGIGAVGVGQRVSVPGMLLPAGIGSWQRAR